MAIETGCFGGYVGGIGRCDTFRSPLREALSSKDLGTNLLRDRGNLLGNSAKVMPSREPFFDCIG